MVERHIELDRTYGALANRIRREMLEHLKDASMRVTELAEPFDVSLAGASKHIRILEDAKLIHRTVSGRDHLLTLRPHPLARARDWIETYRSFWEERLDALEARLRARR